MSDIETESSDSELDITDSSNSDSDSDSTSSESELSDSDDNNSVTTEKNSYHSKSRYTSKNLLKQYKQHRERHIEYLLKNEMYEDIKSLGIDIIDDLKTNFAEVCTNIYAKSYTNNMLSCIWDHPVFNNIKEQFDHETDIILNPPQVCEGAIVCVKCGSSKTINYQLQKRSADEAMTTFIKCMNPTCGKVTKY